MIIYLLDYKQYGDRLARKFDTIAEYESGGYVLASWNDIQFNKNDGVVAKQILNTEIDCSYLIVADDDNTILSRWYITDSNWIRKGQRQLTLYRDLLADFQDIVKSSTCKINRAILEYNDPLIFNSEGINVNQIKTSETLLKDSTKVPWLVAYVDKGTDLKLGGTNVKTIYDASGNVASFTGLPYYQLINFDPHSHPVGYSVATSYGQRPDTKYLDVYTNKPSYPVDNNATIYKYSYRVRDDNVVGINPQLLNELWDFSNTINVCYCDSTKTVRPNDYKPYAPWDQVSDGGNLTPASPANLGISNIPGLETTINMVLGENNIIALNDEKIRQLEEIYDNPDIIYECAWMDLSDNNKLIPQYVQYKVVKKEQTLSFPLKPTGVGQYAQSLYNSIKQVLGTDPQRRTENTTRTNINNYPSITAKVIRYSLTATKVEIPTENAASSRAQNANGLYDMFCTPYADTSMTTFSDGTITLNKNTTLLYYQSLAENNKDAVYDIQILPYCPVDNYRNTLIATGYQISTFNNQKIPMLNIPSDSTTFNISFSDPMTTNNKTRKQRIITDFYRLCDPGYNGIFEFNGEKNNGISYFNVDMTLKPFSPFIHLNPDFGGLYGQDFNDARGLICGSNFSISTISNRFAEYEMNNKNWQQMFNRQIQNLEFTQSQERTQGLFGAIAGTIQGAAAGAGTGAMVGGVQGAVIGGVAGGVVSGIGGFADYSMLESRQTEQRNYMKDMHNYQIDNIKALPNALTRVSTMNSIYKYFPFLEYYTCTEREKTAVNNYINWYSMTVNAIGTVNDYIKNSETFISATPLRTLLTGEDSHVDNVLAAEMEKGFFI